ncbi:MAG: hypothetical protein QOD00_3647 [Blastocatellia bacterium]|nr:hypothetical protein [Blastocatellia bacterium]
MSTKNKKDCAALNRLKAAQPDFPFQTTEVIGWGSGNSACTHRNCLFVSRKFAWRSTLSGRHLICFHKPFASLLENTAPFGFCCGGFSSTAGYVPGNEASIRLAPIEAAYASLWLFLSSGRYPFLSGRSRKPRGLPWQAFRLQLGVSIGNDSRLPFPSNPASPQRSPFPSLVTTPASDATEVVGYTLPFNDCQAENTLTLEPLIFHSLWKNLWKTLIKNPRSQTPAKRSTNRKIFR